MGQQSAISVYLLCAWASAVEQPSCQSAFLSYPTGLARNNLTCTVGFVFQVTQQITVTRLGRLFAPASTQNHDVKLWLPGVPTLLTSGTVVCPPAPAVDTIAWVDVVPVVLNVGTSYRIASNETLNGDLWKDEWDMTGFINAAMFTNTRSCFGIGAGIYPNQVAQVGFAL